MPKKIAKTTGRKKAVAKRPRVSSGKTRSNRSTAAKEEFGLSQDFDSSFFVNSFATPENTEQINLGNFNKIRIKFLALAYKSITATIFTTAIITIILSLAIQSIFNLSVGSSLSSQSENQVVLTESELRQIVSELGQTIYWAGPMTNARYTLSVNDTASFVRYLPEGKGADDTSMNYLIIATYVINGAFDAVRSAGNEQEGISITNSDGAAIYYNKSSPNNIYLAYPNSNFQIEIFDPSDERALQVATNPGLIQPIR